MNTLICNLTRFGDLLQTQPVISGYARSGRRVGLVCLDNFAGATALLRDVDAVFPLSGGGLLAALDRNWREALGSLWQWGEGPAGTFAPDEVLNLTATTSVRLLASHLASRSSGHVPSEIVSDQDISGDEAAAAPAQGTSLRGFGLDSFGFSVNSDPWSTFLQASTRLRGCSPFNLVDLYLMAAGLGDAERRYELRAPEADNLEHADALLHEAAAGEVVRGYVAFQLGASEDRRRWPLQHFAELGDRLWREEGLLPVLLGAGNEAHLAERYAQMTSAPHANFIGRTTLPVLAALLTRMRLLVTNDTGTMHLAAGLGVPVLAVFLATAQPWDTGPYVEGSCTLEPDMDCHPCPFGKPCPNELACRQRITAGTVHALARHWLHSGEWAVPAELEQGQGCGARAWRSCRDSGGFMDLVSLSGHEKTDRTRWVRQQRHFYRQFLDRAPAARLGAVGIRPVAGLENADPLSPELRATAIAELAASAQLLHLLAEQGRVLAVRATETTKQRFLGTWQRLQTLWDNSRLLNVLGYLWMCESQEAGNDLGTILVLAEQYKVLVAAWHDSLIPGE
ncbi:MAG: glycosyltransferase family 9 protein [Halodesulfovibrio sp.]